MNMTRVQVF